MKYTKYNYKRKNHGAKLFTSLIITTLSAVAIGLISAWLLLKIIPNLNNLKATDGNIALEENDISKEEEIENYALIQCGYFSKEENAKQILTSIPSDYDSFITKDSDGKFRVIAGITKESDSNTVIDALKGSGVEAIKVNLPLDKNNEVEGQIFVITEGYLEILTTTKEDEVKEVNTNDFKAWAKKLPELSEGENIETLKEYKGHIDGLKENINREDIASELEYIYSILSKMKK
ncbi:SPOR domain-containing protein [Clostridium tertium]|uniref:SPOR domain-containing protein n=1 Tax=Clostridium tertium TaxID=1559 RepID=A0A6N3DB08_9CLOT